MAGKNAFMITLWVNNKSIQFEIDTGSGVTIISAKLYNTLFKKTPLVFTNVILKTYSGEQLKVLGKHAVDIKHNGAVYDQLSIYVVK